MRAMGLSLIAVFIWTMDRWSKLSVLKALHDGSSWNIIPCLNFRLAFNHGVAFSLFFETGREFPWVLVISSIVLSFILLSMLWRTPKTQGLQQLALVFILAGALGNIFDRIYYGAVVDFIDVYFKNFHWPAFNVADSFICLGAVLLFMQARQSSSCNKGEN